MVKTAEGTGPANLSTGGDVDSRHPDYDLHAEDWRLMRESIRGSRAIKEVGQEYLPMPQGFKAQSDKGESMYKDYVQRAQYPEFVEPTSRGMVGIICHRELQVEMPEAMEPIWERATKDGLSLEALFKKIIAELISMGRYGLLVDAQAAEEGGSEVPWFAPYTTEAIINWSEDQDFYVLDEERLVRKNGFRWELEPKWRVLTINDAKQYEQVVYEGANRVQQEPVQPMARGNKPLDKIPFVIMNPINLSTEIENPPLLGVANKAKSIYQLSGDYRYQLYMSGQETMFVFNMDPPSVIGAGVIVNVNGVSKELHQPDAKYVSPTCGGIDAHKEAIADEYEAARQAGARLFEQSSNEQESGEAKKIRYAAETATLTSIATTAAQGLERGLRFVARMMGLNEEEVIVTPNLSFLVSKMNPTDAKALMELWVGNAISYTTLYENLQKGEIASTERDEKEEFELMSSEAVQQQELLAALGQDNEDEEVDTDSFFESEEENGPQQ